MPGNNQTAIRLIGQSQEQAGSDREIGRPEEQGGSDREIGRPEEQAGIMANERK